MTRQELLAEIETIGKESADDFPLAAELLEIFYCVLRVGHEDLLVGQLRPMFDLYLVDVWRDMAIAEDLEEEHAG